MANVSISIDVPDLDAAQDFYCGALPCTFIEDDEHGIRILDAGNVRIYLLKKPEGSLPFKASNTRRDYGRHWCPIHLDFGTSNIEEAVAAVEAHGGTVEGSDSGAWGSIAYCADPFGNGFCLINE
ncbi:MAG: VOC family protein [Pseudomonadota bacterium]